MEQSITSPSHMSQDELDAHEARSRTAFENELMQLINKHSRENVSNTPDFILAAYLMACLDAFNAASNGREQWYGMRLTIGG